MISNDKGFEDFILKLKKYPTNEIAKFFSKYERECYNNFGKGLLPKIKFISGYIKHTVYMKTWLFPEIIYYSTKFNDYKSGKINDNKMIDLYGLYHDYDINQETIYQNSSKTNDSNVVTYILYGIAQQQFIYQTPYRYINRFCRNYHILKNMSIDNQSLSSIVEEKLSMSLEKYADYLVLIMSLSMNNIILNTDKILSSIKNKDEYMKIIKFLSIDYMECRDTSLGKDVFKVKPILFSQKNEYIVPSFCLLMYNLGDNLYWMYKDRFASGNKFVVKFGEIFEDYVFSILNQTFGEKVVKIPRIKGIKTADFYIEGKDFIYIIEVKSGVAKLDSKTAMLNQESLENFIKNNVVDAIKQIDSSVSNFKNKAIIPIVVNYDMLFVENALIHDIENLYKAENYDTKETFLLDIDDFENLIFTYHTIEELDNLFKQVMLDKEESGNIKVYEITNKVRTHKDKFYIDIFEINKDLMSS